MAGCPSTLPAISWPQCRIRMKGKRGRLPQVAPRWGRYPIHRHTRLRIYCFLCATFTIIRYGLWAQQTVYTMCCTIMAVANNKTARSYINKPPSFVINTPLYVSILSRYQVTLKLM
jgi:hypothetical protein